MRGTDWLGMVAVLLALAVAATDPARAQRQSPAEVAEVLFGTETIAFTRDRDTIKVGPERGQFTRIRLRALDTDVAIRDVYVVYGDGETDRFVINAEVRRNATSRWLDIKPDRFIREVQFTYRARPGVKGVGRVEIYGDLAPEWAAPTGRGKNHNQGWVLIGAQSAGRFFRNEAEVVPLAGNQAFKRLRIVVRHRAVIVSDARLVFSDGDYQQLVDKRVRANAGDTLGPFEIDDETRTPFKEVRLKYRSVVLESKPGAAGYGVVEIWGQH